MNAGGVHEVVRKLHCEVVLVVVFERACIGVSDACPAHLLISPCSNFTRSSTTDYALPPHGLPVERGMLLAQIDVGNGEFLQVIATHDHHFEGDKDVR